MNVTVGTLLKLPSLGPNSRLLTASGLDNAVRYVTILETSNFQTANLGGQILVLTTLSAYCDSLEHINELIQRLCEIPVSAIGIKLARFVKEIDPSTVQIAEAHHVALFALEKTVYFRDILSEMLSVITGNQYLLANQINLVNHELINAILNNCTIQDLLELFCQNIKCFSCCFDRAGRKSAEATSLQHTPDMDAVLRCVNDYFANFSSSDASVPRLQAADDSLYLFPCIVQRQLLAVFCIISPEDPLDILSPLASSIANGIGIKFLEQNLKMEAERELVSSILEDILFSPNRNAKFTAERLELLNFHPHRQQLIILLSRTDSNYKEANHFYMGTFLQRIFLEKFESAVVFPRGREYIVLASYDSAAITDRIKNILSACKGMITRAESREFDLGCSMPVTDLADLPDCYQQAKKAILFGRMIERDKHVYLYGDYLELGLLSHCIKSSDSYIFIRQIIEPLREYDRQYKTELWTTLEMSLLNNGLDSVAGLLHIHISTLRYRLQKIEQITGYSFFNNRDRFTLYLAYLLFKIAHGITDTLFE